MDLVYNARLLALNAPARLLVFRAYLGTTYQGIVVLLALVHVVNVPTDYHVFPAFKGITSHLLLALPVLVLVYSAHRLQLALLVYQVTSFQVLLV
jgi:hypothetical protein